MAHKVLFSHNSDGTTRLRLDRQVPNEAVPLPRELIVDGHCSRPHPDLVAVMSWLCWPNSCAGVVAFGVGVTESMATALGDPTIGIPVRPYSVDPNLVPRRGMSSVLAIEATGIVGRGRNPLGEPRSTYLQVLPIHRWRGRMLSTDSLMVSSNSDAFAAYARRTPGSLLRAQLAVALLFADELRVNRIVAAGFEIDHDLLEKLDAMLDVVGIELGLTESDSEEWRELVQS